MRDDLMKMIVHDLKTPLTSVLATLEMLADGDFGQVTTSQKGVNGNFYDPMVIVNKQKEMPFDLATTAHVKF